MTSDEQLQQAIDAHKSAGEPFDDSALFYWHATPSGYMARVGGVVAQVDTTDGGIVVSIIAHGIVIHEAFPSTLADAQVSAEAALATSAWFIRNGDY